MTVSTTLDRQTFPGDGANKNFPFNFRFLDDDHIQVSIIEPGGTETALVRSVDYTLTGVLEQSGGQVTTTVAPPLTSPATLLLVQRVLPATQPTSIRNQGKFFPEVHENAFDRLTMLIQQAFSGLVFSLRRPTGRDYFDAENYRIANLSDPVGQQDAATKKSVDQAIATVLATGQGPINNAANIVYIDPELQVRSLQDLSSGAGARFIGWIRSLVTKPVRTAGQMLDTLPIDPQEYSHLVTNKPNPSDPTTWDWTPAIQAVLDLAGPSYLTGPSPNEPRLSISLSKGIYRVTQLNVGFKTDINGNGSVIRPFDPAATKSHLIMFTGFTRVLNLTIDMDYSITYDTAIWVRGRHCQFHGVSTWKARTAWIYGDPSWATDPALGVLGDSENIMSACETIWCINAVRAYGQNTILHFNDCLMYSFKDTLPAGDSRKAAWEALTETTFYNWGGLIYINGGCIANYSGAAPLLQAELQPASGDPSYTNAFGKFILNGPHIETGFLFNTGPVGAYAATDTKTRTLVAQNCEGYVSTTAGHFISAGGDCQQSIFVDACNFYGQTNNNIVYALGAKTFIDPASFRNITVDFFQALHAQLPEGYDNFCAVYATSSAQSFSGTPKNLIMPVTATSDVWVPLQGEWYSTTTGIFTSKTQMRNVGFDVSLIFPSGISSDATTLILNVNGSQVDIATLLGSAVRVRLFARRLATGDQVTISVTNSGNRSSSGVQNTFISVVGSI